MPLQVCVCDNDATTPEAPAIKAAQRAPRAELQPYYCGHFEINRKPEAKADQVAFLQKTFGVWPQR
jgi:hypothetical protein